MYWVIRVAKAPRTWAITPSTLVCIPPTTSSNNSSLCRFRRPDAPLTSRVASSSACWKQREDALISSDETITRGEILEEDLIDTSELSIDGAHDADSDSNSGGIIVTQVSPQHTVQTTKDNRPRLPSSIKKLNKLLSYQRTFTLDEADLEERFVKGRGPGGQAINKTNSSVSLTHIPTGIRIQAQPTRSREQNRKAARQILIERLDQLRARTAAMADEVVKETPEFISPTVEKGDVELEETMAPNEVIAKMERKKTKKEEERALAGAFSKDELRWEKERRRKANRAKKAKKKKGGSDGDVVEEAENGV